MLWDILGHSQYISEKDVKFSVIPKLAKSGERSTSEGMVLATPLKPKSRISLTFPTHMV